MKIALAYDGTDFKGWASQPGLRTVQGVLEESISTILRLDEPARLTVAGRTDAGVHARGQVAHVDLDTHPGVLERRLRRIAPSDIRIISITEAHPDFDARFAATERRYVYRMTDHAAGPDPLAARMITPLAAPVDIELMHQASLLLLGEHDFAAFCKQREGASTVRELKILRTVRGGETIATTFVADAFCHSMVRAVMGGLVAVGQRKITPDDLGEILERKVRDPRVKVMPPGGLVLEEVSYPADEDLAARVAQTRQRRDEC
ncbi:MAG: tRNA pseudouridine(38-40) synthase TruA [Aeromicrobium sp.]|nr:MAG: tRNA pseudouridine(38-40) synthase TruA [Aeromicrobium sp.]